MSEEILDLVAELLSKKVGDPYRLEHIKASYHKTGKVWQSDRTYVEKLREAYLQPEEEQLLPVQKEPETTFDDLRRDFMHCWKCGMKNPNKGNFCMNCGVSLYNIGTNIVPKFKLVPAMEKEAAPKRRRIPIKLIIIVAVIVIAALAAGEYALYAGILESDQDGESNELPIIPNAVHNPKCSVGTVYIPAENTCVLGRVAPDPGSPSSSCGPGTRFDTATNSCILT